MKHSKVVMLGCGSANLFAALHLIDKGYNPKDILIIESGSDPVSRTSMLKGFAGAGLKSDGKFVFSGFEDPVSKHVDPLEREYYHTLIQDMMKKYLDIPESGVSNPTSDENLNNAMMKMDDMWGKDNMVLRQSTVWHIGTDNELIMAINMYNKMLELGVNMMLKCTVTDIDFDNNVLQCLHSNRTTEVVEYEFLQIGAGKVGVDFVDTIIAKYGIDIDPGYANVGGRFETRCSDAIKKFADEIQYDFKFLKEYDLLEKGDNKMQIRTFCTCNYSAYVMEEGINGTRTYNGHAYGKNHEKENGMTNFGVMARIKGIDAPAFHKAVLSKYGKQGCVIRGKNWDGVSTIEKVGKQIEWIDLATMYRNIDGDVGVVLAVNLMNFIERMDKIFSMNGNWSYYIPEIKMAVGVINTDRNYRLADGRYPNVTWVGDSCTGSVGIVPAAVTGMRAIEVIV